MYRRLRLNFLLHFKIIINKIEPQISHSCVAYTIILQASQNFCGIFYYSKAPKINVSFFLQKFNALQG